MAHAQKPDFVFQRNGRVHLNRQGRQFSRLLAVELCASAVVMLDTPCSSGGVKGTGYALHSAVSPSLPLPCVTVCHHVSKGLYTAVGTTVTFGFFSLQGTVSSNISGFHNGCNLNEGYSDYSVNLTTLCHVFPERDKRRNMLPCRLHPCLYAA